MNPVNALNWFEIFTADLDRARAFYSAILDQPLQQPQDTTAPMAIFPCDMENGIGGSLTQMDDFKSGRGGTLVYLNVDGRLDDVIARVAPAGGKIIKPRFAIPPHGFIALFEDTEGNLVGLHSMS